MKPIISLIIKNQVFQKLSAQRKFFLLSSVVDPTMSRIGFNRARPKRSEFYEYSKNNRYKGVNELEKEMEYDTEWMVLVNARTEDAVLRQKYKYIFSKYDTPETLKTDLSVNAGVVEYYRKIIDTYEGVCGKTQYISPLCTKELYLMAKENIEIEEFYRKINSKDPEEIQKAIENGDGLPEHYGLPREIYNKNPQARTQNYLKVLYSHPRYCKWEYRSCLDEDNLSDKELEEKIIEYLLLPSTIDYAAVTQTTEVEMNARTGIYGDDLRLYYELCLEWDKEGSLEEFLRKNPRYASLQKIINGNIHN